MLARTRNLGDDPELFPYTAPSGDVERQRFIQEYGNLDLVERTRTVPFNVAVTWELVVGAIVPVMLQLLTFVVEPL